MKSAVVHGVLLVAMFAFAYQTWTRDTSTKKSNGDVVLWNENGAGLQSITDETPDRTLKIEKRGDGANAYFWGSEVKMTKVPKKSDAPPLADGGAPPPEFDTKTTTTEFPVDPTAMQPLIDGYAAMRAVRDLGTPGDDDKDQFGLKDDSKTLEVAFAGKTHSLILGGHPADSEDRYALDVDSGHAYILAAALVGPLETGKSALGPKTLIPTGDDVAKIDIATPDGQSASVSKISVTDPQSGKQVKTWGDPATNTVKQTTANWLTSVEAKVHPSDYATDLDVSTLTKVVTITYHSADKTLATVDVYKKEAAPPQLNGTQPPAGPTYDYYVVSELTHVPAKLAPKAGDTIESNLPGVFSDAGQATPGNGAGSGSASAGAPPIPQPAPSPMPTTPAPPPPAAPPAGAASGSGSGTSSGSAAPAPAKGTTPAPAPAKGTGAASGSAAGSAAPKATVPAKPAPAPAKGTTPTTAPKSTGAASASGATK